jgi:protein-tyrosine phosphatase
MMTFSKNNDKSKSFTSVGIEEPSFMDPVYNVRPVVGQPNLFRAPRPGYPSKIVATKALKEALLAFKEDQITDIFVLLTDGEYFKYYGFDLLEFYRKNGFVVHRYPIPDFGVPRITFAYQMAKDMHNTLTAKKKALVHCSAGQGRTGLAINCLIEYRKASWKKKMVLLPMEATSQTSFLIQFRYHLRRKK